MHLCEECSRKLGIAQDMDFKIPQCVQKALHEYVDFGAIGYYRIPDGYYDAFINWEKKHFNFEVKREWLRFAPGVVAAFNWMIQMLTKKGMQLLS